jgi:hypothetical protein
MLRVVYLQFGTNFIVLGLFSSYHEGVQLREAHMAPLTFRPYLTPSAFPFLYDIMILLNFTKEDPPHVEPPLLRQNLGTKLFELISL